MITKKQFLATYPPPFESEREIMEKDIEELIQNRIKAKAGQHEKTCSRLNWPDVHFVIKYMIENINTERLDINDQYDIEKLTDTVFSEYQNWKNKKEA